MKVDTLEKEVTTVELRPSYRGANMWNLRFEDLFSNEEENNRTDYGNIEELALSIKESGQQNPITVFKDKVTGKYGVADGFRRYRAFKWLFEQGIEFGYILGILAPINFSTEDRLFAQILKNDGKPLTTLEFAEVIKKLKAKNYSIQEIATRLGRSTGDIKAKLSLASVPQVIKQDIHAGVISSSLVQDLTNLLTEEEVINVIAQAKERKTLEESFKEEVIEETNEPVNEALPEMENILPEKPKAKSLPKAKTGKSNSQITRTDIEKVEPKLKKLGAVQRLENLKEYLENSEVKGFKMSLSKLIDWLKENKSNEEFLLD